MFDFVQEIGKFNCIIQNFRYLYMYAFHLVMEIKYQRNQTILFLYKRYLPLWFHQKIINRFIGSLVENYSQKSQKIIRRIRKLRVLIRKMHVRIAMVVQTYYLMQYFKGFIWISSEIGKNMNISTNWASRHVNSYRWVCKQRTVLLVKT